MRCALLSQASLAAIEVSAGGDLWDVNQQRNITAALVYGKTAGTVYEDSVETQYNVNNTVRTEKQGGSTYIHQGVTPPCVESPRLCVSFNVLKVKVLSTRRRRFQI